MRLAETLKEKREEILKVAARRGATNVRLLVLWPAERNMRQVMWICWCSWRKDGAFWISLTFSKTWKNCWVARFI